MEQVMEKFNNLMMGQQFDFLDFFLGGGGPKNPEPEVVALYEEWQKLPKEEQNRVESKVKGWAFSLTREEMFIGAREERRRRSQQ